MTDELESLDIDEGMFFPKDFKNMPENTVIYIKKGRLIVAEEKKGGAN